MGQTVVFLLTSPRVRGERPPGRLFRSVFYERPVRYGTYIPARIEDLSASPAKHRSLPAAFRNPPGRRGRPRTELVLLGCQNRWDV